MKERMGNGARMLCSRGGNQWCREQETTAKSQLHHYILGGPATVAKMYLAANTIKVGDSHISSTTKLITDSIGADDSSMKCRGVETRVHAKARATFGAHFEIALTTWEVRKLVSNCKTRLVRLGVGLGVRNVVVQELQFVGRGGHRTTIDVPTLVITGHCNLLIHRITVNTHLIEFKLHVIEGARCRINGIDTGVEQFHVHQVGILNQTGEAQG
jgi:hypothetical protein